MRIAITGATGNVGTSLLAALADEPAVEEIVAIARRHADLPDRRVRFHALDLSRDDLSGALDGVDAVVHLAWLIQPSRDEAVTYATNVTGTVRLLRAAVAADVRTVIFASSVGVYAPGPKDRPVDESWPATGIETSFYSRQKATVERLLDRFEADHPDVRVVRLRPGLIFKREAAREIQRLFIGPLLPAALVRDTFIPLVPAVRPLRFQAVHSLDVGEAYRLALLDGEATGAFNIAADPVIDPACLAALLDAQPVAVRAGALRAAASLTWRLHLQPSAAGWIDLAYGAPLLSTARARSELGWRPRFRADDALRELIAGLHDHAGSATPPLAPDGSLLGSTPFGTPLPV